MSAAYGFSAHRIRVIVTATTQLAARQLAVDLSTDPALQIKTTISATELVEQLEQFKPAVVLLDTELTGAETPQLAKALAHLRSIAVVIYAPANERAGLILDALESGAIATTTKPASISETPGTIARLIRTLRAAAAASIPNLIAKPEFPAVTGRSSPSILAMGAGIGGLPALAGVITQLPKSAPGTMVITGLDGSLTAEWTHRMSRRCSMQMKHAADGDTIESGQILIAPGGSHMLIRRSQRGLAVNIKPGPSVFHQRPSLDLLFNSLSEAAARSSVAAVFSGSGVDGVAGLLNLRQAGGRTLAQLPQTCPCDELPTRVLHTQAAAIALPANEIAKKLLEFAEQSELPRAA